MKTETIEFISKDLLEYQSKIGKESQDIIDKIIEKYCPIIVGEKIKTIYGKKIEWLEVSKISLMAIDSWGQPGNRLSFKYEGLPLKKDREPMKNRKPVWFGSFEKNGKIYCTPSYSRLLISIASMHSMGE